MSGGLFSLLQYGLQDRYLMGNFNHALNFNNNFINNRIIYDNSKNLAKQFIEKCFPEILVKIFLKKCLQEIIENVCTPIRKLNLHPERA